MSPEAMPHTDFDVEAPVQPSPIDTTSYAPELPVVVPNPMERVYAEAPAVAGSVVQSFLETPPEQLRRRFGDVTSADLAAAVEKTVMQILSEETNATLQRTPVGLAQITPEVTPVSAEPVDIAADGSIVEPDETGTTTYSQRATTDGASTVHAEYLDRDDFADTVSDFPHEGIDAAIAAGAIEAVTVNDGGVEQTRYKVNNPEDARRILYDSLPKTPPVEPAAPVEPSGPVARKQAMEAAALKMEQLEEQPETPEEKTKWEQFKQQWTTRITNVATHVQSQFRDFYTNNIQRLVSRVEGIYRGDNRTDINRREDFAVVDLDTADTIGGSDGNEQISTDVLGHGAVVNMVTTERGNSGATLLIRGKEKGALKDFEFMITPDSSTEIVDCLAQSLGYPQSSGHVVIPLRGNRHVVIPADQLKLEIQRLAEHVGPEMVQRVSDGGLSMRREDMGLDPVSMSVELPQKAPGGDRTPPPTPPAAPVAPPTPIVPPVDPAQPKAPERDPRLLDANNLPSESQAALNAVAPSPETAAQYNQPLPPRPAVQPVRNADRPSRSNVRDLNAEPTGTPYERLLRFYNTVSGYEAEIAKLTRQAQQENHDLLNAPADDPVRLRVNLLREQSQELRRSLLESERVAIGGEYPMLEPYTHVSNANVKEGMTGLGNAILNYKLAVAAGVTDDDARARLESVQNEFVDLFANAAKASNGKVQAPSWNDFSKNFLGIEVITSSGAAELKPAVQKLDSRVAQLHELSEAESFARLESWKKVFEQRFDKDFFSGARSINDLIGHAEVAGYPPEWMHQLKVYVYGADNVPDNIITSTGNMRQVAARLKAQRKQTPNPYRPTRPEPIPVMNVTPQEMAHLRAQGEAAVQQKLQEAQVAREQLRVPSPSVISDASEANGQKEHGNQDGYYYSPKADSSIDFIAMDGSGGSVTGELGRSVEQDYQDSQIQTVVYQAVSSAAEAMRNGRSPKEAINVADESVRQRKAKEALYGYGTMLAGRLSAPDNAGNRVLEACYVGDAQLATWNGGALYQNKRIYAQGETPRRGSSPAPFRVVTPPENMAQRVMDRANQGMTIDLEDSPASATVYNVVGERNGGVKNLKENERRLNISRSEYVLAGSDGCRFGDWLATNPDGSYDRRNNPIGYGMNQIMTRLSSGEITPDQANQEAVALLRKNGETDDITLMIIPALDYKYNPKPAGGKGLFGWMKK